MANQTPRPPDPQTPKVNVLFFLVKVGVLGVLAVRYFILIAPTIHEQRNAL